MNRLTTIAVLLLLSVPLAGTAWAQGTRKDDIVLNRFGQPVAGATVTVCTSGATGTPCSPLAAIYSDLALTQPKANPFTTDGQGNYSFYAAAGRYKIQISGAGVTTTTIPDVLLATDPAFPNFQSLNVSQGITAFSLNLGGNLGVTGSVTSSTSVSAPQTGSNVPVQVGSLWYPGTATGLVTPPGLAPAVAVDSASGGSITAGTYFFKFTYGNKNGETPASPASTGLVVTGTTNRLKVAANNDLNWLTGAYKMQVYASNDNVNFYPQTPWSPSFNIASPGGCVRVSNVVTCTVASGVFGLTPQQSITVANVPNGTTSFNGTFTVSAVNSTSTTFSYAQTAANDTSGTGTGTVSYSTAIDTNWAYVGDGGGNDVVFSALTFSGSNPPTTNTATIDALQVAVNAARTQPPFVGFNLREGAVQLDGKGYTLTTPLILGHMSPEVRGQTGQVGIEAEWTGGGSGTQITSSWNDVNTGTVMVMSRSSVMRNITVVGTSDTNAVMILPGFQDNNGIFMNGITFQANANSAVSAAVRVFRVTGADQWDWQDIELLGGRYCIYVSNSSTPSHWELTMGRMNVGTNALATAVTNDGGPTDYYHGANFSGFPSGMWMAVRHYDVEQNRGPAFDVVQGALILDQVTNSDVSQVQSGSPASAVNIRQDAFSTGGSVSGLWIYGGRMFGSSNAVATIAVQPGVNMGQLVIIGAQIESSASGVAIALNGGAAPASKIGAVYIAGNNSLSLNQSATFGKVTGFDPNNSNFFSFTFLGNATGNTDLPADLINFLTGRLKLREPFTGAASSKTLNVAGNVLQFLANDGTTVLGTLDDSGNLAGLSSMAVGGDPKFSASPREPYNAFLPGSLTSTWTGETFTLDKAITVTRVQAQAKTAPAGCTTNAIVRVTDGTSPVNLTIAGAASDSGSITQNYAAGAVVTISVQTAAAGCTTSPADVNVVVQYRMQ